MVLEHLEGTLYELIGDWRAIEEVCVAGRVHADCMLIASDFPPHKVCVAGRVHADWLPHQVGGLSASECMLIGSLIRWAGYSRLCSTSSRAARTCMHASRRCSIAISNHPTFSTMSVNGTLSLVDGKLMCPLIAISVPLDCHSVPLIAISVPR